MFFSNTIYYSFVYLQLVFQSALRILVDIDLELIVGN